MCFFLKIFVIFLNSASSAAALVFYLPGVCTHTDTKGKQRKTRVRNILKSLEKKFNEDSVFHIYHTVFQACTLSCILILIHRDLINRYLKMWVLNTTYVYVCNPENMCHPLNIQPLFITMKGWNNHLNVHLEIFYPLPCTFKNFYLRE